MSRTFLLIFIMFMIVLVGCKGDDNVTDPQNSGSDFVPLPLSVGNLWTYNSTTPVASTTTTNSITGSVTLNGVPGFRLNDDWLFDNDGCYYNDGILYGCKASSPSTTTEVVFPKNPSVGQTWTVDSKSWTLEAINVSVTVPAGTFSCHKIRVTKSSSSYSVYWADGKGIVKIGETADPEHHELKSIQLN